MRPEPKHTHQNVTFCHPQCPFWRWEVLQERREAYYIRKQLEYRFEQCLQGQVKGLQQLRTIQREHPNLWPRG